MECGIPMKKMINDCMFYAHLAFNVKNSVLQDNIINFYVMVFLIFHVWTLLPEQHQKSLISFQN